MRKAVGKRSTLIRGLKMGEIIPFPVLTSLENLEPFFKEVFRCKREGVNIRNTYLFSIFCCFHSLLSTLVIHKFRHSLTDTLTHANLDQSKQRRQLKSNEKTGLSLLFMLKVSRSADMGKVLDRKNYEIET